MSCTDVVFDQYHVWLGIPPAEQPPTHYRLLGIAEGESDPEVIDCAADRQMAHIRSFATGKHSAASQRLLNELAAARLCLLNPGSKARYDRRVIRPRRAPPLPPLPPMNIAPVFVPVAAPIPAPTAAPIPIAATIETAPADSPEVNEWLYRQKRHRRKGRLLAAMFRVAVCSAFIVVSGYFLTLLLRRYLP